MLCNILNIFFWMAIQNWGNVHHLFLWLPAAGHAEVVKLAEDLMEWSSGDRSASRSITGQWPHFQPRIWDLKGIFEGDWHNHRTIIMKLFWLKLICWIGSTEHGCLNNLWLTSSLWPSYFWTSRLLLLSDDCWRETLEVDLGAWLLSEAVHSSSATGLKLIKYIIQEIPLHIDTDLTNI